MGPLNGLKVLDLTRVLSGPYATMVLADFGANIIKIEPPKVGDDSRAFGPFVGQESAYYMSLNRNKRSMCLDFKNEKHKDVFRKLVSKVDMVVENYRPGTMEKFGLGYEELKKINPQLIYVACSGFGRSGPYARKPAYDVVVQAMGGIMSITGSENGEPTRVGASVGDIVAGIFSVIGALLALIHKQKTGEGQLVDVSMMDCQVAILENAVARYVTTGIIPKPLGNRHPSITPFCSFTAKDGSIIVGAGNDRLWVKLCNILNRPDLLVDERFASNPLRTNNVAALHQILNEELQKETVAEWMEKLEGAGVPCAPINNVKNLIEDPQLKEREMFVEVEHPIAGKLKMPGIPIKMSVTPGEIKTPAPILNHDLYSILYDLMGWNQNTVDENLN
mgnify:CR=1 FL=1